MTYPIWRQNSIRILLFFGIIYVSFALHRFLTNEEVGVIYKSLFVITLSLIFPIIAMVQSAYVAIAIILFLIAVAVVGKQIPEKHMMAFIFMSLLVWIVCGYIAMTTITGGA